MFIKSRVDDEQQSVDQYVPEQMSPAGDCSQRNAFGYPSCFTTVSKNGKLYFRLGSYGYSRTRASDACNVMGGYLAVTKSQEEHEVG